VTPGSTQNPTLAEASQAALKVLSQNPAGFFLMIEQGDIDTANHAGKYNQMIACSADLEQAVAAVIDYVNQPDDDIGWDNTVLMVVADHATGYMRLNPGVVLGSGELPEGGDVSYGTAGHSNELVHLSITGHMAGALSACEGREYPGTQILNNTVLHSFILRAAGL